MSAVSSLIPSFKATLPTFEPKDLGPNDIAVEYHGEWYLIGEMAQIENALAERMQHGDFSSMEIQLMARAAAAKAIAKSATLETDVAVAAPLKSIDHFRTGPGETRIKDEQLVFLQQALREIRFRTDSTHGEVKTLKIKITNAQVLNELAAVLEVIPEEYTRFGLIQWGHGDLQVISVNEGQVVGQPTSVPGLWSAMNRFQQLTKLPASEAQRAFLTGYRYNGAMTSKISCSEEIEQAISHHVLTDLATILNALKKNNQKNVIVSGGTVHNSVAIEILRRECKARDLNLYTINELVEDIDPQFSCLRGLRNFGRLRLDIGHSSLKSEWEFN